MRMGLGFRGGPRMLPSTCMHAPTSIRKLHSVDLDACMEDPHSTPVRPCIVGLCQVVDVDNHRGLGTVRVVGRRHLTAWAGRSS